MSDDYVSRDYLLGEYDRQHQGPPGGARKIIAEAPAADVVEVRHECWIEDGYYGEPCVCSYCGEPCKDTVMGKPRWHYCPNCGAKMDGGHDEAPAGPYDILYEEGGPDA